MKPTYKYVPIVAEAHTPPYKIHKYFARRPHNVFASLITNYSACGEVILDPFCGGGVTIYEGLTRQRKMIGCDLNPLSIFIVRNMVKNNKLSDSFLHAIEDIRKYLTWLHQDYLYFELDGKLYPISWAEMALAVRCPKCGKPTPLANSLKVKTATYHCYNKYCGCSKQDYFSVKDCERSGALYVSLVSSEGRTNVSKPFGIDDKKRYDDHIKFLKSELKKEAIVLSQDLIPMDWDRQFEDGLSKKGIIYFQDLFTKRNLYILELLLNKIKSYESALGEVEYELLRMVFSNVLKDANIMSFTNDGWQSGKPTTWSKHAYWIPNQFCEVSIPPIFERSVARVLDAVKFNQQIEYTPKRADTISELLKADKNLLLYNSSVSLTDIPDNSVDAIITDPPYGSNVQYLELSHFWYPWNKDLYERYPVFELEAISNRKKGFKGAKSQYTYEANLKPVFAKSYSCLKDGKYMTLTFNNKDMSSWLALLFSIFSAGFEFVDLYFQDGVKNYKQTAHTKAEGSPYGDFIYVFRKSESKSAFSYANEDDFIRDIDALFNKTIGPEDDKNTVILNAFVEAIPLIEGFVQSYIMAGKEHSLYTHFNKNYLSKFYTSTNEDE